MGNRAVITTSKALDVSKTGDLGIYLHWNGGRDSVEAFLKYCELKGYRSPSQDNYGWDNGVYIIDKWEIVDRQFFDGAEQDNYDQTEMLIKIDEAQPKDEQFGEDFFKAELVNTSDLKIGDKVYIFDDVYSKYELHTVVGIGEDEYHNGTNVLGMPYVDKYLNDGTYSINLNNYIRDKTVRKIK